VLCLNGDALFDFSLKPLISAHVAGGGAVSTLALREVAPGDPFGRVGVDAEGRVVRIAEVEGPRAHEEVKVGAFTGAQIIGEETAKLLSPVFSDTFRTAHRELLSRDVEIRAHFVEPQSLWVDIGNLERYLGAHRALLERPESPLWRYVPAHRRQGDNIIFEGAELSEGVKLGENVWVGAGATLSVEGERALELSESVIWDDSSAAFEAHAPQTQPQRVGRVITPDLQL
jgi:NDP-sugar pyrophosphorylase family protein